MLKIYSKDNIYTSFAYSDFSKAIDLNPSNPGAYRARGYACVILNKLAHAIADFTKAIRLNPHNPTYYNDRGSIYLEIDRLEEAVQDFTNAIKRDPEYAAAYYNRGLAYQKKKDLFYAIVDHLQALKLKPYYYEAKNNLENMLKKTNEKGMIAIADKLPFELAVDFSERFNLKTLREKFEPLKQQRVEAKRSAIVFARAIRNNQFFGIPPIPPEIARMITVKLADKSEEEWAKQMTKKFF